VLPQAQKVADPPFRRERPVAQYGLAAKNLPKAERSLFIAERWWNMVLGAPLFLRTLLRLVFCCSHRHKGPPITLRVAVPSSLSGSGWVFSRETHVTCLDCGQKFAYDHKTRQMVDFWGVHDAEALARVRRRFDGFFSPLRGLGTRINRVSMRIESRLDRSVLRIATLTKSQWIKLLKTSNTSKWHARRDSNSQASASKTDALSS
jgi:hypothetical protein